MAISIIRVIVLYSLIIISIRLMGKRQIGELEPSELVLAMIISDLAAVPMQDMGIPLLNGILPIIILLAFEIIISVLNVKSIRFRELVCGRPSIVIDHGHINQKEMQKNRFTVDELFEELRMQSILDISKVKYAILEINGHLSTMLYPEENPPSAGMLNIFPKGFDIPTIIVSAGRIIDKNLSSRGLDRIWLKKQLDNFGVASEKDVFLLTVDQDGRTYFASKEATS